VFFWARLYADATLQVFFIISSLLGWWHWLHGRQGAALPVRRTPPISIVALTAAGALVAAGYGLLLHRFTNAYAPFLDSVILAFSVLGQFLLVGRRLENWWCWLLVNTIAVPLYAMRGLRLTALLYAVFWVNAVISLRRWKRLAEAKDSNEPNQ
jgi:nicotinamide mononucleotide transporter